MDVILAHFLTALHPLSQIRTELRPFLFVPPSCVLLCFLICPAAVRLHWRERAGVICAAHPLNLKRQRRVSLLYQVRRNGD